MGKKKARKNEQKVVRNQQKCALFRAEIGRNWAKMSKKCAVFLGFIACPDVHRDCS